MSEDANIVHFPYRHRIADERFLGRIRKVSAARIEQNRLIVRFDLMDGRMLPLPWLEGILATIDDPDRLTISRGRFLTAKPCARRAMTAMTGPLDIPLAQNFVRKLTDRTVLRLETAAGECLEFPFLSLMRAAKPA